MTGEALAMLPSDVLETSRLILLHVPPHLPLPPMAAHRVATGAFEKDVRQGEEPERLPEADAREPEQLGYEPVPEHHGDDAAEGKYAGNPQHDCHYKTNLGLAGPF
jgi:hypothetical protein